MASGLRGFAQATARWALALGIGFLTEPFFLSLLLPLTLFVCMFVCLGFFFFDQSPLAGWGCAWKMVFEALKTRSPLRNLL